MIQVICCKCGKELGWKSGGDGVSHGLCNPCLAQYQEELAGLKAGRGLDGYRSRIARQDQKMEVAL